ncbi:ATP-dependent DNA ligase [Streptomyces sp. NPDC055056]
MAFERLQHRMQRRGTGAARAAGEWPSHFVAFDLLRLNGNDVITWPYRRRRTALESVFSARRLTTAWTLCPSTTDQDVVVRLTNLRGLAALGRQTGKVRHHGGSDGPDAEPTMTQRALVRRDFAPQE